MTKVPQSDSAAVHRSKILGYLLNRNHEKGAPKAQFFLACGFNSAEWQRFADALCAHARENDYTRITNTSFGAIYTVQCALHTPDGADPCIRSVWEVGEDRHPRLITAYPF